jgi:tetratricopeptide (TPR) repeat protein
MKYAITLLLVLLISVPVPATTQTRDSWRSVRTNNLFVIGNADAEKLRQVAVWLEFFHSAFGRLVSRKVIDASVPTTVIVFRDEASFVPFKPLYQGRPANLSGFFQPGEDVNYIAMSLDPRERDPFSVAFHEYVHLHLRDNVPGVPLWLNEGLAEFYGSLEFSGNEAILGAPLGYIRLLRSVDLLPLKTLFSIDSRSPHYNEQDKTGVFYGQSWALVHYLMLGGGSARQDQFKRFLNLVGRGDDAAKAMEDSFGMTLDTIENELRAYIRRNELPTLRMASDDPQAYASYTAMQRVSLSEAEANYYLGDLLLHIGRAEDADRYFKQAIALDPTLTMAYSALGQLAVRQRRYADAKKYLQKATLTPQHYLVHYHYAWVLGREAVTPTGHVKEYAPETAAAMREQLLQTIKLAPDFAPAYYLLAMVDLVAEKNLDEALEMIEKARRLEPTQSAYTLLAAEIHAKRGDDATARSLLDTVARDSNQTIREEAQHLLEWINNPVRSSAPPRNTPRVSAAEPVITSKGGRTLGGDSGGTTAIRDGQTIQSSNSLPTVDELLARYVEAMGGEKAIKSVTSRAIKGTIDIPGVSRGGVYEIYQEAPNKIMTYYRAHPIGRMQYAYNGRVAWLLAAGALKQMKSPTELQQVQREADIYAPLRVKANYAKVTLVGMSQIGYRDVYVLDLQPALGAVERFYLDAKTYLPARINTIRKLNGIAEPVEIYLDDWKAVDGVQIAFSVTQRFAGITLSFTVTEIKHNLPLDMTLFEQPIK